MLLEAFVACFKTLFVTTHLIVKLIFVCSLSNSDSDGQSTILFVVYQMIHWLSIIASLIDVTVVKTNYFVG